MEAFDVLGGISWITLTPTDDGGARFALEHPMGVNDHWEQYGPGAAGVGWDLSLMGLALHLETGEASAAAGAEWGATDEGRDFMTRSSAAWGEAAVAGGRDAEWAGAAADRTTAAYTAA